MPDGADAAPHLLASVAFVAAIVAWIANYFSGMHRFIAS